MYSSALDGLPGNDDLGTMGAWYVFACMGLYPEIPAVGGFAINSPIFSEITMHLPGGDVVIKGGSEKEVYIQSMKLDGKAYDSTWLEWEAISGGATIDYKLGSRAGKWGAAIDPPSFQP
jgi:putative alpha-1,2-mannosidase